VTEGQITEVGITYTRLETEDGTLNMPNSQVLASAVGPIPRPQPAAAQSPTSQKPPDGTSPAGPVPGADGPAGPASNDQAPSDPARTGYDDPPRGLLPGGGPP